MFRVFSIPNFANAVGKPVNQLPPGWLDHIPNKNPSGDAWKHIFVPDFRSKLLWGSNISSSLGSQANPITEKINYLASIDDSTLPPESFPFEYGNPINESEMDAYISGGASMW